MTRRIALLLALCAALFLFVSPVLAGGWGVFTLDSLPPQEINTGESLRLGFMVRQHGETPVHKVNIAGDQPLTPLLTAINQSTGERLEFPATPDAPVGHFTVEFSLPSEGQWQLTLSMDLLEGRLELEPMNVRPASTGAAPQVAQPVTAPVSQPSSVPVQGWLRAAGWTLVALAALTAVAGLLQRRKPAVAQAGD
jgi:hypothetical protein